MPCSHLPPADTDKKLLPLVLLAINPLAVPTSCPKSCSRLLPQGSQHCSCMLRRETDGVHETKDSTPQSLINTILRQDAIRLHSIRLLRPGQRLVFNNKVHQRPLCQAASTKECNRLVKAFEVRRASSERTVCSQNAPCTTTRHHPNTMVSRCIVGAAILLIFFQSKRSTQHMAQCRRKHLQQKVETILAWATNLGKHQNLR